MKRLVGLEAGRDVGWLFISGSMTEPESIGICVGEFALLAG